MRANLARGAKAVDVFVNNLEYLGYSVTLEDAGAIDPAGWLLYDFVLVSSGDNTSSLGNAALRTASAAD